MNRWLHRAALVGCCALGSWLALRPETSSADLTPPSIVDWSQAPTTVIVATPAAGDTSSVYLLAADGVLPPPAVQLQHAAGGNVRAELTGDGKVLVTARASDRRDTSYDGGLYLLDPSAGTARELCREVVHASRPLVSGDGRIFVARGSAGNQPSPDQLRIDVLTIDRVDPDSGATAAVHSYQGYMLHLAGWYAGELLIYRVGPDTADIVALDPVSQQVRTVLASLPAFARDFSVDRVNGRLVYRGRHESDPHLWVVDAVSIGSGARRRLHEGGGFSLAPHAWPDGGIAISPWRRGLELIGSTDPVVRPLGAGVDLVRDVGDDGRFVALLHTMRGKLPVAYLLDRHSGRSVVLPTPTGTQLAIAGLRPAGAGGDP